jgi:hypothetical protein
MNNFTAARIILAVHRCFRFLNHGAEILFEGICLGLQSEPVLDSISEESYGTGSEYTNDTYLDSGFQFWEQIIIDRFFTPGSRVLVAAAGGGREIIALCRAGFSADGFECSKSMVAAGRLALLKRGIGGVLNWAPPCRTPKGSIAYSGAIVGWNGYTYIVPSARRVQFLRELCTHLRQGSPIVISGAMRNARAASGTWVPAIANRVRQCTFRTPSFDSGVRFPGRPRQEFTWSQLERETQAAGISIGARYRWGPFFAVVCHGKGTDQLPV